MPTDLPGKIFSGPSLMRETSWARYGARDSSNVHFPNEQAGILIGGTVDEGPVGWTPPKAVPEAQFFCLDHSGKKDLEKSVPTKLRARKEPGVRFIIVQDNDRGDCKKLKQILRALCAVRAEQDCLIRIVCQELEAWFLAEPDALAEAFRDESLRRIGLQARFRRPDDIPRPARALAQLIPEYQKISGARTVAVHLTRERNQSPRFQSLLAAIEQFASQHS